MAQTTSIDYIIVGQGLAGAAVALQLISRGRKVMVFDRPEENSSSAIAAGLYNPVTGRKMGKTWLADRLFPYLSSFYKNAEAYTQRKFLFPTPIYRPFINVEEQNEWMAASADHGITPFINTIYTQAHYPHQVYDAFGGLLLAQSGYVNTKVYMDAVRARLMQEGLYQAAFFVPEKLRWDNENVVYQDITARKIIFCEGEAVAQNKFFYWLPIRPLKGETITVRGDFNEGVIFNRGAFLVPECPGLWKVGATYAHTFAHRKVTPEGRQELQEKLKALVKVPFTITDQEAGIRPAMPDRRPVLGAHPEYSNLIVFNGLGTKGVSLAPYFSNVLVDWLENGAHINKEVDISRYKSLYWNSLQKNYGN